MTSFPVRLMSTSLSSPPHPLPLSTPAHTWQGDGVRGKGGLGGDSAEAGGKQSEAAVTLVIGRCYMSCGFLALVPCVGTLVIIDLAVRRTGPDPLFGWFCYSLHDYVVFSTD